MNSAAAAALRRPRQTDDAQHVTSPHARHAEPGATRPKFPPDCAKRRGRPSAWIILPACAKRRGRPSAWIILPACAKRRGGPSAWIILPDCAKRRGGPSAWIILPACAKRRGGGRRRGSFCQPAPSRLIDGRCGAQTGGSLQWAGGIRRRAAHAGKALIAPHGKPRSRVAAVPRAGPWRWGRLAGPRPRRRHEHRPPGCRAMPDLSGAPFPAG